MTKSKKSKTSTSKNFKSRGWFLTINNPIDKGFTHEKIKEILETKCAKHEYWCMSDEIGKENGTPHTHLLILFYSPISFSSMQNKFKGAHLDAIKGQPSQVRNYILKGGKWENHDRADTKVEGTFEEQGTCPKHQQGERTDLQYLYNQIEAGVSTNDIINENPKFMLRITEIERVRQMLLSEKYKGDFRKLDVTYIWGDSGTGKTRGVMEKYGYDKVYRITNYDSHPFDNYKGEDILVLEEFRSSFRLQDMLNYLDGYPLQLPCRYADKVACYTKVYIITNIPFEQQFETLQKTHKETWEAFKRRMSDEISNLLNKVKTVQTKYGITSEYVFANKEGRVNSHTITCAMSRRCKDAGIEARSIHAIRRTVSSHLRAVLPIATVANMLGHLEETNDKHYNYDISEDKIKVNCLKEMYHTFKKIA